MRPKHLTLGDLIAELERHDPNLMLPLGFTRPHSYRGYYEQLAFELEANVTIGEMLAEARHALGKTFTGYKGGEFTMNEWTYVWIAEHGSTGESFGRLLLSLLIAAGEA